MEEKNQKSVVNHFEAGSNCQVFNGSITGCVFAMPGSAVTQQPAASQPVTQPAAPQTQQAGEPLQEESEAEEAEIPEVLTASPVWQQLQDSGLVDAHSQPRCRAPRRHCWPTCWPGDWALTTSGSFSSGYGTATTCAATTTPP